MVSIFFFIEIEIVTTKVVNSKSLKKICRQLVSTMNVLKKVDFKKTRHGKVSLDKKLLRSKQTSFFLHIVSYLNKFKKATPFKLKRSHCIRK